MARGPRHILPNVLQAVVTRTAQSRFLLRPDPQTNLLIIGVLAMAQQLYPDVAIYFVAVPSNHMHMLLSAPRADLIAKFMEYVNGNIAREVGRRIGWRGLNFWGAPYSSTNVVDDGAALQRFKYQLAQCCKDGLVADPRDWPGVHAAIALCAGRRTIKGLWIDRSGLYNARRAGRDVSEADFTHEVTLELSRLPQLDHLSDAEYTKECVRLVEEISAEAAAEFDHFKGARRVLRENPHARPNGTKKTKRPVCHASDPRRWFQYLRERNLFRFLYRLASPGRDERPDPAAYPPNCFLPGGYYVAA